MSTRRLTLDLHPIYNKGRLIDEALEGVMDEAEEAKAKEVEIICGKGSGQLKKRVLRFLNRKDVRARYHRINKDPNNSGRVFVYFRWSRGQ
jgi:DNA-nicking Smr family endonuclease